MRKLVSTAALWLLYVPLAHAQSLNNGSLDTIGNAAYGGQKTPLPLIVGNMIKTFIGLLGIVFLVLTVYAGFLYLTAQDDLGFLFTVVFEADPPFVLKIPSLSLLGEYEGGGLAQESVEWIAVEALRRSAQWFTSEFGGVDPSGYSWGDRHGTRFENPYGGDYDGGWTPTDGGEDTLNVSSSVYYANSAGDAVERFESKDGPIFRFVSTFAEDGTPQAIVNFPRGNAGEPSSPHWDDTLNDWVEDVYTPFPYTRDEVEAVLEQTIVLEPSP